MNACQGGFYLFSQIDAIGDSNPGVLEPSSGISISWIIMAASVVG